MKRLLLFLLAALCCLQVSGCRQAVSLPSESDTAFSSAESSIPISDTSAMLQEPFTSEQGEQVKSDLARMTFGMPVLRGEQESRCWPWGIIGENAWNEIQAHCQQTEAWEQMESASFSPVLTLRYDPHYWDDAETAAYFVNLGHMADETRIAVTYRENETNDAETVYYRTSKSYLDELLALLEPYWEEPGNWYRLDGPPDGLYDLCEQYYPRIGESVCYDPVYRKDLELPAVQVTYYGEFNGAAAYLIEHPDPSKEDGVYLLIGHQLYTPDEASRQQLVDNLTLETIEEIDRLYRWEELESPDRVRVHQIADYLGSFDWDGSSPMNCYPDVFIFRYPLARLSIDAFWNSSDPADRIQQEKIKQGAYGDGYPAAIFDMVYTDIFGENYQRMTDTEGKGLPYEADGDFYPVGGIGISSHPFSYLLSWEEKEDAVTATFAQVIISDLEDQYTVSYRDADTEWDTVSIPVFNNGRAVLTLEQIKPYLDGIPRCQYTFVRAGDGRLILTSAQSLN